MARPTLPPSPSPITPAKREPHADTTGSAAAHTPRPPPHKKRRRDSLPVTPTQHLLTPQTIPSGTSCADSFADERSRQPGLSPTTAPASVKREPDADAAADADVGEDAGGKVVGRRHPYTHARPPSAEAPTLWANRHRLGRLLHELTRAHRWRDAAGVLSALLPGTRQPESFEEARSMFVVAMEIHRRLAEDSGVQHGGRSRYYLRTQKVFDVWMRRLIWLPTCAKKHLVKLELALFYLSQGNIDNAYNATRTFVTCTLSLLLRMDYRLNQL